MPAFMYSRDADEYRAAFDSCFNCRFDLRGLIAQLIFDVPR